MWSKNCCKERNNHFSQSTFYVPLNTAQDIVCLFFSQGALLVHIQLAVYQDSHDPFQQICSPLHQFPACTVAVQTLNVHLLNFRSFLLVHSSSLSRSLWMAVLLSYISTAPFDLAKLSKHSVTSSRSLIKSWTRQAAGITSAITHWLLVSRKNTAYWSINQFPLSLKIQSVSMHVIVHPSIPQCPSLNTRILSKQALRALPNLM